MQTQIEINAQVIVLPDGRVYPSSALYDVLQPEDTGQIILPDGLRILRPRPKDGFVFVVEVQPGVRRVKWAGSYYTLAFPYVIIVGIALGGIQGDESRVGCHVYYRNSPLTSLDDELRVALLRNVYMHGNMCIGHPTIPSHASLRETVARLKQAVFVHHFNGDIWDACTYKLYSKEVGSYKEPFVPDIYPVERWQELSLRDPMFVLSEPWPAYHEASNSADGKGIVLLKKPLTLRSLLNEICREPDLRWWSYKLNRQLFDAYIKPLNDLL